MKRLLFLIPVLACVAVAAYWLYQKHESKERWEAAYQSTRDAYKRAAEYKDSGILLFQPRFTDMEKSVDALTEMPNQPKDDRLSSIKVCEDYLLTYRAMLESALDSQSIETLELRQKLFNNWTAKKYVQHCIDGGRIDQSK